MGEGGKLRVTLNFNKYGNEIQEKGFWLFKHCTFLNYFGKTISTKIEKPLLGDLMYYH
jgi:hypothetical protein